MRQDFLRLTVNNLKDLKLTRTFLLFKKDSTKKKMSGINTFNFMDLMDNSPLFSTCLLLYLCEL